MSIITKVSLGTVNYTDWLRVTAAPVGDEGNIVFEQWYDVPAITFFYLTLPQEIDYVLKFYDAPTNTDNGILLQPTLIVNGRDTALQFEERWYEIGNMPTSSLGNATVNGTGTIINDPYLFGKEIFSYFKEGKRFLKITDEILFDNNTCDIEFLLGEQLSPLEKFRATILNRVSGSNGPNGFAGTIDITAQNYSVVGSDVFKRFRLLGTASSQTVILPLLSAVPGGGMFYFDNTVGGVAVQPKILTQGTDRILYNGFLVALGQFAEFWVSKGKTLQLQNGGTYWEVVGNYDGDSVGERFSGTYFANNCIPEDGRLLNGDDYPRLYWWLRNVMPATHKIIDDNVINTGYNHGIGGHSDRVGQFILHSVLNVFMMPNTQELSEKGLFDFTSYGNDSERAYDYPGGFQPEMVGPHNHTIKLGSTAGLSDNANDRNVMIPLAPGDTKSTDNNVGLQNRVDNFGVIYLRRI